MLALGRRDGDWVSIRHRSGDVIGVRVFGVGEGRATLAFDDEPRNFEVSRSGTPRRPRPELVTRPDGVAVVKDTGIPADYVVMLVAERGWSHADLLAAFPALTHSAVRACLARAARLDAAAADEAQGDELPYLPMRRAHPARV